MRLEQMTVAHVQRAVDLYLELAWPPDASGQFTRNLADLSSAKSLADLRRVFEPAPDDDGARLRRYMLRLGNSRYPFMKFVVQEYLVNGEYFFSADTHDNLEIGQDAPDYAEWEALKVWNRELKTRIEAAWHAAGLPTNVDLRNLVEGLAREERGADKRQRLLLVDDEEDVCAGLAALLRARGYAVDQACDGAAALARLAQDPLPDLVLLDYEMPEFDGEEVLRRMKASERLRDVPVLLATASDIELSRLGEVAGFLRKPYPRHLLFQVVERLLAPPAGAGEPRN